MSGDQQRSDLHLSETVAELPAEVASVTPTASPAAEDLSTAALLQRLDLLSRPRRKRSVGERLRTLGSALAANPKVLAGLLIIAFFVVVAAFGPLVLPHSAKAFSDDLLQPPSATHWFGTTDKGEDVFAQVVAGARYTLLLGFGSGLLATMLSVTMGLLAGYFAGVVDDILSLIINIFLVLPGLPLAIVLSSFAQFRGPVTLMFVLLLTTWAYGARVLRAQTLSLREREFVTAARAVGEKPWRIVFTEIMPNEIGIIAASLVSTIIYTILAEVGLEFLGLGDVTGSGWGVMLFWAQNAEALLVGAWWWFLPPGLCIALLGAGLVLINFGIDELANPRLRRERAPRQRRGVAAGKAVV